MSKKKFLLLAIAVLLIPVLVVACTSGDGSEEAPPPEDMSGDTTDMEDMDGEEQDMEPEEMGVDPSGQTVAFWHVWGTGAPGEAILAIVEDFNASNEWGITVTESGYGDYPTLFDAVNAAIETGEFAWQPEQRKPSSAYCSRSSPAAG